MKRFLVLALLCSGGASSLRALTATLNINAGSAVNTFIPVQAFGVNAAHNNYLADVQAVQAPLQSAGISFLRYPGGSGSDHYHWNGTGSFAGNIWVPSNSSASPGFTCDPLNNGTSAAGISKLTDGLTITAWISHTDTDFPNAQWAYVDLGSKLTVNQVQLWWGVPYATSFKVQYWDPTTGNQWSPYQDTADHWLNTSAGSVAGAGGQQTVNFTAVSTQYVRVLLTGSSAAGYAIDEIKVFNGASQLSVNAASNPSNATVSSCTVTSAATGTTQMDFDQFMSYCGSFSPAATPVITVNFGTGTPQEAAAWVHYANVVKGYHVQYWEIGNELMGNWEAGGPLSATDYGRRFLSFYAAMTAEDPSIKLLGPVSGPVDPSNDLNTKTFIAGFAQRLSSAGMGAALGGVDIHVYAGYNNDSDAALLPTPANWAAWATSVNAATAGLPSPGTLPVVMSEYNANSAGTNITVRLVNALWAVNWLGQYLTAFGPRAWSNFFALVNSSADESSTTAGSFSLFEGTPGPYDYQPFASYWALQMLSQDWAIAGDTRAHTLVSCNSTAANLIGYADLRPDGDLSLIVSNQDNTNAYSGTLNIAGYSPVSTATTYTLSSAQYAWATGSVPYHVSPDSGPLQAALGGVSNSFTYNFPAYSLTVFRFHPVGTATPTPSPTQTPAGTFTFTPSPTASATPAPTACATKVCYNGETGAGNVNLSTGNYYTTNAAVAEDAASAHGGTKGVDITYSFNAFWGAFTNNFANYNPANAFNVSTYDTVEFWVRVQSGSLHYLYIQLGDSSNASSPIGGVGIDSYLPGGITSAWQRVDIPLSAFSGINTSSLWMYSFYISGVQSAYTEVYVDDFSFLRHCATPTPAGTLTATMTPSATPSATGTRTRTATPSDTQTPSDTATMTPTATVTATLSPTATPSGTGTITLTPSPGSSTATPIQSATQTPLATVTASVSPSPTSSATIASATPSPSATASASAVLTATQTATLATSPAGTATPTATPLAAATATGTGTPTAILAASSTAAAGSGALAILRAVAFPDPNPLAFAVDLDGAADGLELKIYSDAEALVAKAEGTGRSGGWSQLPLGPAWANGLSNGTYFARLVARRGGLASAPVIVKLSLIR